MVLRVKFLAVIAALSLYAVPAQASYFGATSIPDCADVTQGCLADIPQPDTSQPATAQARAAALQDTTVQLIQTIVSAFMSKMPVAIIPLPTSNGSQAVTGGTAVTLFSGVAPVNGFLLEDEDATNDCWFSVVGTAVPGAYGSLSLPHLQTKVFPLNMKPPGPVSVYCAQTVNITALQN